MQQHALVHCTWLVALALHECYEWLLQHTTHAVDAMLEYPLTEDTAYQVLS